MLQLQAFAGNAAVNHLLDVQRELPPGGLPDAPDGGAPQPTPDAGPKPDGGAAGAPNQGGAGASAAPKAAFVPATGPPPPLSAQEESNYESQANTVAGTLTGGQSSSGGSGHTPGGPIDGFPEWFRSLQDTLVNRMTWTQNEETAQQVLYNYAMARFAAAAGGIDKVPPTVRVYCMYIGRSTANQRAAAAGGFRSSANVGGAEGAKMWCAAAGSSSIQLALKSVGLAIDGDYGKWLNSPPGVPAVGLEGGAAVDAEIRPGDQVSYIGGGAPATGGHTVTALSESKGAGTVFDHASGNAGGGTSGSIRLGSSSPRAKPPRGVTFARIAAETPAALGAPNDKVWVYVIVRYSVFWEDLGNIDMTKPDPWSGGDGAAFLKKHKLRVLPGGAVAP